ncbi:hypothetical protein H5410_044185 [Solanum commersonii]|uniref:Uncharacterized protein n=1 Tax=Solanum commersonii TaxID=4109 RepID=A0A9J5X7R8_SOLCO|nr:hypothetical protein H5410_044185 [Solanum commersonii]
MILVCQPSWRVETTTQVNVVIGKCDLYGLVIALELDNELISSGVENSSALLSLEYLEKLNLVYNRFDVGIPVGIYNLVNLKYLNLSNAGFFGQIPMTLSRLTRITELRELYLDGVDLSAQRNEWCQSLSSYLRNWLVWSLRGCRVSGPIDDSLSNLRFLSVIYLDQNNLSTTVPEYFAKFSNLTSLSLSSCNLHGAFPETIFRVQSLEMLDLSNNKMLSGRIPNFPKNGSLRTISLSNTKFSGLLPKSISNLQNLSKLELSNCNLSGPIPSTMENLTKLVYLGFSLNNFTGSIPYFQQSKKLTYLDLSYNSLTGLLSPAHFEGLSELVYMNLGNNLLNGILPAYIFELPSLQKLFFAEMNLLANSTNFAMHPPLC